MRRPSTKLLYVKLLYAKLRYVHNMPPMSRKGEKKETWSEKADEMTNIVFLRVASLTCAAEKRERKLRSARAEEKNKKIRRKLHSCVALFES